PFRPLMPVYSQRDNALGKPAQYLHLWRKRIAPASPDEDWHWLSLALSFLTSRQDSEVICNTF
ncbi:MAG TPA: hypothetical protein VE687_16325, partial [Stellaceae bacterium]|nr:hypothetical protein [Stellaceae bacterium]